MLAVRYSLLLHLALVPLSGNFHVLYSEICGKMFGPINPSNMSGDFLNCLNVHCIFKHIYAVTDAEYFFIL